jgi:tetratricopeptide (TPR) repeat protein
MSPKAPFLKKALPILLLLAVTFATRAETTNPIFQLRAEKNFAQARKNYLANTNSITAALELARTGFDLADLATNEARRAEIARYGIEASRRVIASTPKSAAGHYYLAMNLGELAQAEAPSLAAYRLVHEVEREFKIAAELDARYDYAGPARNLGQLYFQAPGWPLSVGSKTKAHEWLQRAVTLAPEYPENQLNLAEAQLKWHQREELDLVMKNLKTLWPAARTNLVGEVWEQSWQDWDARHAKLLADYQKVYPPKP